MLIMASREAEDIFFSSVTISEVRVLVSNFHCTPVNNLTELNKKDMKKFKMLM